MADALHYPELFRAVAHFVEREHLKDVCVLELEGGVLIQGYALIGTTQGFDRALKTQTLTHDELRQLLAEEG